MWTKVNSFFSRFQAFVQMVLHDPFTLRQIFRFCGVGILNTIVGYAVFFLLVPYIYYLAALLIAHVVGVLHSFLWNKYWIFKSRKFNLIEFIKFNLVYAVVFAVNAVALFMAVDILEVNPRLAQLLLLPVITLVSFFGQKCWTFGEKINRTGEQW